MVVVTGAETQIGQALVHALVAADYKVRVVLSSLHKAGFDGLSVERVVGSMSQPKSLIIAFVDAEMVFHCDGHLDLMPYRFPRMYSHNVKGTEYVIHACRINRVKRLIYVSSYLAFGHDQKTRLIAEQQGFRPFRAINPYGRSKALASQKVQAANGMSLETVIIAPSAVIGPYDYDFTPLGLLMWDFSRSRLPAYSRGGFDLVDSRDLADVCMRAAVKAPAGSIYLVSSGHTSMERFMRNLQAITGQRRPWIHLPHWMMLLVAFAYEIKHRIYGGQPVYTWAGARFVRYNLRVSSQKLRDELGFEPRPIKQSIAEAWTWYKDHHHHI